MALWLASSIFLRSGRNTQLHARHYLHLKRNSPPGSILVPWASVTDNEPYTTSTAQANALESKALQMKDDSVAR